MVRAILLALIAACAASLYGLLALWVGRGRGPWFVRAAVLAGAIGMLIFVPAYDLAIVFLSESLAIIAPLWLLAALRAARRRTAADESQCREASGSGYRFSLTDLFLFTLFAAGIASLGAYLPAKHRDFWLSYALIGAGAGVVSLAAAWAALGRRWKWLRWALLAVMAPGIGLVTQLVELPTELGAGTKLLSADDLLGPQPPDVFALNAAILTGMSITACLSLLAESGWLSFLAGSHSEKTNAGSPQWRVWARLAARVGAVALPLAVSIAFGIAYVKMLYALPIPHVEPPDPNGYLVLAKLGEESTQGGFIDIDRASEDELRTIIATNQERLTSVRTAFFLPHVVPVDYTSMDLIGFESVNKFRQLQRLFDCEGKLATLDGRPDDAATSYLDEIRLGDVVAQGGLQIDELVGRVIENIGLFRLCEIRRSVSPETSWQLIETVQTLDDEREPFAAFQMREAVWQQHAYGWAGRIVFDRENESAEAGRVFAAVSNARRRLLICDLAIRLCQAEYGTLPENLEKLAPEYLRELPIDPFSGRPPVYRPSGEAAFLLYSIGPDAKDDGGKPTEKDNLLGDGDLVLDP